MEGKLSVYCGNFIFLYVQLTLELPIVNTKLFLPKPVKMTGLKKIRNNRIFLYLLITEGIPCCVVHFWYY